MRLFRLLVVATVLCISTVADQITLNNGDRLTGKIVTADEKALILQTKYAGELKVDRTMVTRIETDELLNVTVREAGTVKGTVEESATLTNIVKADGTSITVKPEAVTAIRNDSAQTAYERESERLSRPRLNDF